MSRLPTVRNSALHISPDEAPVPVGSARWRDWVRDARSFTFTGAAGTFTARHEERSGRHFWYAYRQQNGLLRKAYLGRSGDLTLERLEHAAEELARTKIQSDGKRAFGNAQEMWAMPLIATKIAAPQSAPELIARPTVVARCLAGIERSCAIVAAPAGFGKTTVLITASEELRKRGWDVAWVTIEETERDPVRFWSYALAALDAARPGIGDAARRLLAMPRPQAMEHVLTALINELASATAPLALVLDDYHRAASPASDAGLTFLIEHAPATLHLVVATRAEPALPLARLRAQGRVAELHVADLRFSEEDAGRFLRETMHVSLPADQLAWLEERTEGWVAGLQLAALSLRDSGDVPSFVADFSAASTTSTTSTTSAMSATPRFIAEYLIDEVLEHQPEDVQSFLLQTASLERLSAPLCDVVTGRNDSAAMLARLMQAQLFVTPLDAGRTWYRYHHLFADVLRERLARSAPDVLERCHRRAADWLGRQGAYDEAIRHLIAARAFTEAATLMEGEGEQLILRGEIAGLVAWVRALPRKVVLAHPHLCTLFAVGLFLQGEGAEAAAWLDELERHLAETGSPSGEVAGEIAVVRAILRFMAGDFASGAALAGEALKRLSSGNQLLYGLALWLTNVVGMLGEENLFETEQTMAEIAEDSLRAGNILVAFMALITKAGIELYQGRLHRAAQTSREALRLVPSANGEELPIAAMAYCFLGELRREWNDLDGAEDDLRHGLMVASGLGSGELVNDGYISLAMVQAACGKYDEALATFDDLRRLIRAQQLATWDLHQLEMMRVRVLIADGQIADAARWAEGCRRDRQGQGSEPEMVFFRELEDLALARVSLAQGCAGEVITPLEIVCAQAATTGRTRNLLEAKMLLARARWMLGEHDMALRELDASLECAAPEGFIRMYLDEGEPMADLLAAYVAGRSASRERTHAVKLLAAFGRVVELPASSQSISLSQRELEVLRLLVMGRSNDAIASELVVARSTVKWHVAQIYRKLGVTGRVQAAARARELRLIA